MIDEGELGCVLFGIRLRSSAVIHRAARLAMDWQYIPGATKTSLSNVCLDFDYKKAVFSGTTAFE